MDNRRITQKPWGRLWNFVPLKGEGEAGSGGDCSDVVETWSREAGGCALYATDTRIGCRLSLPPGKALRCSPWGAGEALRCLLLRTAEKALRCFPLRGGFNLVSRGRKWGFVRNRYVIWVQAQPARKTSHREIFLDCANRKLAWGLFSYKSPLFCNPNFGLQNSPAKAPDDKELRPLRRATSRRCPLDTRHLLKKVDENFYFANSVPRGKNSGYLLNRYAIWARHHAA